MICTCGFTSHTSRGTTAFQGYFPSVYFYCCVSL